MSEAKMEADVAYETGSEVESRNSTASLLPVVGMQVEPLPFQNDSESESRRQSQR